MKTRSNRQRVIYGIEIECTFSNPPWRVINRIRSCLYWINKDDLQGIGKIVLTDIAINASEFSDCAISARGFYMYPTENSPPIIYLTIPEFYKWIPLWLRWSPAVTLRICETLAHEVGHHVSLTLDKKLSGIDESQSEEIARTYARTVISSMTRNWFYKFGDYLIKELSGWYYALGLAAAKYERYQRAADRFYAAWHLTPEMKEAAEGYWRARREYEKRNSLS